MQKSSRSFMSRLVLPGIMVALLPLAGAARAAVITTFDVSGTAAPIPLLTGTTFSGTLTLDVTSGTVTAEDVPFPGLSAFDMLTFSGPFQTSNWTVTAFDSSVDELTFDFTTTKKLGSLVGFTGGTILDRQA